MSELAEQRDFNLPHPSRQAEGQTPSPLPSGEGVTLPLNRPFESLRVGYSVPPTDSGHDPRTRQSTPQPRTPK